MLLTPTYLLGCPTLHDMHNITPSQKYVIQCIKTLFPPFSEFSCIVFFFAARPKTTKDFQNV
jgi:hypothetical protein